MPGHVWQILAWPIESKLGHAHLHVNDSDVENDVAPLERPADGQTQRQVYNTQADTKGE